MRAATNTKPKPVGKQSAYELRNSISELLREDFTDRLAEFERLFSELGQELEKKESAPPRSDFWNLRVMIVKENLANYNRINNNEAVGCIWQALGLEHVGKPDHMELACRTGNEYDDCYVVHLADFELDKFPGHMRAMCKKFFNGSVKFEFFLKPKLQEQRSRSGGTTNKAEVMTVLFKIYSAVVDIETTRCALKQKMEEHTEALKGILKNNLETHADEDEGDEWDEELDDAGRSTYPSPKRRKTEEVVETDQQQISLDSIELRPGSSVETLRIREFRGEPEPHFVDLMGAIATGDWCVISKRLPSPRAPSYSDGAELVRGLDFKLEDPGDEVARNTVVTQKMKDTDQAKGTNLVGEYESMHHLAHKLSVMIADMVKLINSELEFVVRVHTCGGQKDYNVNSLSHMQKYSIGNLYLDAIAVNKDKAAEEESEGEESGEESEGEDDDDASDAAYNSDSSSDEEGEDCGDSASEASDSDA